MRSHLRYVTKRKVSDFLTREEGMVGSRTTFATAALVSTASLAMCLLDAHGQQANKWCGAPNHGNCFADQYCCYHEDNNAYNCTKFRMAPPWRCW